MGSCGVGKGLAVFTGLQLTGKKSPDLVICMNSISWFIVIES